MNSAHELLRRQARRVAAGQAAVPSPCASVCRMDMGSGLCEGCLRTLDEIGAWGRLDEGGKRQVWTRLAERAGGAKETP